MSKLNNLLEGVTILDFSHRLPGPLCGHVLSLMGAEVIKIEDQVFRDSFDSGFFADFDPSFRDWYKELNIYKEVIRIPFKDSTARTQIEPYLKKASALIMGLPPKVEMALELTEGKLNRDDIAVAIIKMGASTTHQQHMHDINALALSGLLKMHVFNSKDNYIRPPFLPTSGIAFGQQLATDLLATLIQTQKKKKSITHTSYLYETADLILGAFFPKNIREERSDFLHNGKFPCYGIYRTKDDQYIALAAVEEKFWQNFIEAFEIDISAEQRFSSDQVIKDKLIHHFQSMTQAEIESKAMQAPMCLTCIR